MKKFFAVAAAALTATTAFLLGACKTAPVSVHDPSVFYDEKTQTYYAFGSHFAVASSKDLISWDQLSGDGTSGQELLFGTTEWRRILDKSSAAVGGNENTWAPDVEYYNGKYYMYYSLTAGASGGLTDSVVGRVSSENVLGPYSGDTIIVSSVPHSPDWEASGGTGVPNAIDPELFYDTNGGLWMVYGSHRAGIHIKELYNEGENWGLPKERGFGKRVWALAAWDNNVEGPFVFYNAETQYYYLLTSYGDLATDYNIRVARSKSPDGPYVGITGRDMATNPDDTYNLAGNYRVGNSRGVAAIGHCSVTKNKAGEYILVAHARHDEGGGKVSGAHEVMTFKLLFNEDGWPLMSPCTYAGEAAGEVPANAVAGDFEVIEHTYDTSPAFVNSKTYTFKADGTIVLKSDGSEQGSWTRGAGNYITIKLFNYRAMQELTYKGVLAKCKNNYAGGGEVVCVSAVSDFGGGRSLWAIGS